MTSHLLRDVSSPQLSLIMFAPWHDLMGLGQGKVVARASAGFQHMVWLEACFNGFCNEIQVHWNKKEIENVFIFVASRRYSTMR